MTDTNRTIEEQIKKKIEELSVAVEKEKRFLGSEIVEGKEIIPVDFYEMAEAFDTTSLRNIELDILLAKQHMFKGWEKTVEVLERQAKELRGKIIHWKNRDFPSPS